MSIKKTGLSSGRPSTRKTKNSMADTELMVRVNVDLTEASRKKLRRHAVEADTTISALIRGFIDKLPD